MRRRLFCVGAVSGNREPTCDVSTRVDEADHQRWWGVVLAGVCQDDNGQDIDPSIALNNFLGSYLPIPFWGGNSEVSSCYSNRGKTPGTQVQHDRGAAHGMAEIRRRCGIV